MHNLTPGLDRPGDGADLLPREKKTKPYTPSQPLAVPSWLIAMRSRLREMEAP